MFTSYCKNDSTKNMRFNNYYTEEARKKAIDAFLNDRDAEIEANENQKNDTPIEVTSKNEK